ncbi:MAG TPA: DUF3822 family protein [Puia sp.]|nr:DUF3822 family protein [Puia sp.]
MQKPVLQLQATNVVDTDHQTRLLMEVNNFSFSYVLLNLQNNSLVALKYFEFSHLKDRNLIEILREIIFGDELLVVKGSETYIVYNVGESNLIPEKFYSDEVGRKITEIIYGNLNYGLVLGEKIPWWELYNVYRIPGDVNDFLQERFGEAKIWHKYSLLLKSHKMFNVREYVNFMKVIFYSDKIIVMVSRDHQLQLIQAFPFKDANDVAYHLLNCCYQFSMPVEEAVLQVSGLIDRQSAVYNELLKYFLHFLFDEIDNSIHIEDSLRDAYPAHYYSSFLKMAVCV